MEEEVDTSLRGRLLSLVEKIKSIRGKKTEEKPEVEEEIKPSKISKTLSPGSTSFFLMKVARVNSSGNINSDLCALLFLFNLFCKAPSRN